MSDIDLKDYKIVCGAMSWISDSNLVSAISNSKIPEYNLNGVLNNKAKALGVLATGAMNAKKLEEALITIKKQTNQVFAVNLININPEYEKLLSVCKNYNVPIIVVAASFASANTIEKIKATGAKVIGFATSITIAKGLIRNGIDAIILEGSEAGGHVGSISTSVLVQEILFEISSQIPIIVAGGIGCGKMIAHYLQMGASGVQLGTRFACAKESPMHIDCKNFYIKKQAKDTTVVSALDPAFSVIPVRVIKNKAVEDFYKKQKEAMHLMQEGKINAHEAQLMIENFWSGSLRRGVLEADLEYGSLMSGQSVSFVNSVESVQEIIDKLFIQVNQAFNNNLGSI